VVPWSVNQRLPSTGGDCGARGAAGVQAAAELGDHVLVGLIRPIALVVPLSVNQMFPSGPAAIR
jgi:hypothetical protein